MIGDFIKKKTHKKKRKSEKLGAEEYIDLGELVERGGPQMESDVLIKVAEVHRYEDIRAVTDELYDGNILIVDTEDIAGNEEALHKVHQELKAVANDVGGDVAGLSPTMIAVTPPGIGVDRKKIKPF